MKNYYDSFDCEIQCEEYYNEDFDYEMSWADNYDDVLNYEDYLSLTPEEEALFTSPL